MLHSLRHWLIRLLSGRQTSVAVAALPEQPGHRTAAALDVGIADAMDSLLHDAHVVPYDEDLLERTRTQWQFGDWHSLAQLDRDTLQHHPDRAKLALLAAAGRLQTDRSDEARQFLRLAQDWGVSKKLISQILIAGVHNSLGRAAAVCQHQDRAQLHFEKVISIGTPSTDKKIISRSLFQEQLNRISALFPAKNAVEISSKKDKSSHFVIANGMPRSGTTVLFNILVDIFKEKNIPFVKYYIDDFKSSKKIRDHINQNKDISVLLKTHRVDDDLIEIVNEYAGVFIYTKRNIFEVSASYIRMSRNVNSPFFKSKGVCLQDLLAWLERILVEYENAKKLNHCLFLESSNFSDSKIISTVKIIADYLCIYLPGENISEIAKNRTQAKSANISEKISAATCTSLGHDSATFFHKDHVFIGGTPIDAFLDPSWKLAIYNKFFYLIDENGEFL